MKKFFKNLNAEDLTKGGIIVGIASVVVGTVAEIVEKVRHDKREDKLYAKLVIKADEVKPNFPWYLDTLNEVRNGEDEEEA